MLWNSMGKLFKKLFRFGVARGNFGCFHKNEHRRHRNSIRTFLIADKETKTFGIANEHTSIEHTAAWDV